MCEHVKNTILYCAIWGMYGAGKSTLARGIIQSDGGCENREHCAVTKGGKYTFAGNYVEGSKYGGADGLRDTKELFETLKKCDTPVFISEGVRTQSFGTSFLEPFFYTPKQIIVYLEVPAELCCQRTFYRSGRKTFSNVGKEKIWDNALKKFTSIGVPVYKIDARQNEESVLKQALEIIRRYR